MVSFDSKTIYNAWKNLNHLDAKIGGMFCILSCINEEIVPNKSYKIDGIKLRQQLSYVFDKEYKSNFSKQQENYIIFAKNWFTTFFENEIKNKIDLLSCAVFFLRRRNFENPVTSDDVVNNFLHLYNLSNYKEIWFENNSTLKINYSSNDSKNNQDEFYSHLSSSSFYSITFNNTLQKYAYDLSAAGHIQTLYSAKGILKTCIFSNEPLDSYYIMENTKKHDINNPPSSTPTQTIYYGVPGSGKSHKIDEQTQNISEEQKIRVVFHPEYTNADFIGQVLPKVEDGTVKYEFKPGPFTKILYRAYHNSNTQYYLIIEEINRGNAAAIFGDVFQLLDRIEKGGSPETVNENTFGEGWSKYFVENDFINNYLRSPVEYSKEGFTENHGNKSTTFDNGISFTANTGIRLPPNLSLFATMNTSDQNVFTLDNAFQRRWEMELVQNQCNDSSQMDAKITVNNQSITWKNFQTQINSIIGEKSNEGGLSSMEDKRLGCWFIKAENNAINEKKFANKVLKYLWDDAFKFYHQEIFESDIKNFEELQKRFFEKGFDVFSENCGLKDFLSTSQPDSESKSETTTPQDSESQSETSEQ